MEQNILRHELARAEQLIAQSLLSVTEQQENFEAQERQGLPTRDALNVLSDVQHTLSLATALRGCLLRKLVEGAVEPRR